MVRNLFKVAVLSAVALLTGCDDDNDSRSQTEFEKNSKEKMIEVNFFIGLLTRL